MRIIYRMRGLLGDATEEFIESLDSTTGQNRCSHDIHVSDAGCCTVEGIHFLFCVCVSDEEEDDEEVYKMAGVMAQCGGLECMLNRLSGIKDFKQGRHLLTVRVFNPSKFVCCFFFFFCKSVSLLKQRKIELLCTMRLNSASHPSHLQVLLKLFSYCVKVKINRQQLVKPEMNTLNVMLGTLNLVGLQGGIEMTATLHWFQVGIVNPES